MSVLLDNRKLAKLMVDAERIVMLGDYYDGAGHWEWMTQFLEHSEDGRVTWLLGNHDAQYMFPHP
jgi:metallophosphoesterase superfamily enzyme